MQGGLAQDVYDGPTVTEVATGQQQPRAQAQVEPREAGELWSDNIVRLGRFSLTIEELHAIAIIAQVIMAGITMFMEMKDR
jgi:hypothetical protein